MEQAGGDEEIIEVGRPWAGRRKAGSNMFIISRDYQNFKPFQSTL